MVRLLDRPLIARIDREVGTPVLSVQTDLPGGLLDLFCEAEKRKPGRAKGFTEEGGGCTVAVDFDYDDLWRGLERDVQQQVSGAVEEQVTFLTPPQKALLERAPLEFLDMYPPAATGELLDFRLERIGGVDRVVSLHVAAEPEGCRLLTHVAVVPNLLPLQRQLAALHALEAAPSGSALAALRVLMDLEATVDATPRPTAPSNADRLDQHQQESLLLARTAPHFALIQGPPGSGKSTLISELVRAAVGEGKRVLVVSPTHVAVDNVVEKLATSRPDMSVETLPVRYSSKVRNLLPVALDYWVGPEGENRRETIAARLRDLQQGRFARALVQRIDPKRGAVGPLSQALSNTRSVLCGTPIGLLSHPDLKETPTEFDLLIVDEVSKMTMPEFLAIAVRAKQWVLVGDPEQLPPYVDADECGTALDDIMPPALEVVCSAASLVERLKPERRQDLRIAVVARDPDLVARAIRAQLNEAGLSVSVLVAGQAGAGLLVCSPDEIDTAVAALTPVRGRDRNRGGERQGRVEILVERGIHVQRPDFASGTRFVDSRWRMPARLFDTACTLYHLEPWTRRARQQVPVVREARRIPQWLPSGSALAVLGDERDRNEILDAIALRYALNAVSIYDWLSDVRCFDLPVLRRLRGVMEHVQPLLGDVRRGVLKKQYRMHASLSKVPRDLFYSGRALLDAGPEGGATRVRLVQVVSEDPPGETNRAEATVIRDLLERMHQTNAATTVMVITPYRAQERLLRQVLGDLCRRMAIEVCTLDRCQGREADCVLISLVRSRSTRFLDAPKRWNVALTRARQGLLLVGDIDGYLAEAARGRRSNPVRMSVPARILAAYNEQERSGHEWS